MLIESKSELAFDTSLYKDLDPSVRGEVLAEDLAGFFIEAGERGLEARINPRILSMQNGEVFDPLRKRLVLGAWRGGNPLADSEKKGADRFYGYLGNHSTVISISPEGGNSPYKESRITIAHKIDSTTIHLYGIPTLLDKNKCVNIWKELSRFSAQQLQLNTPDDLREIPIPIDVPQEQVWNLMKLTAPLDSDAWDTIAAGTPWKVKKEMLEKARRVIIEASPGIVRANSYHEQLIAGAWMETLMEQETGWSISGFGCPGKLNGQMIRSVTSGYTRDTFGAFRITVSDTDDYGERDVVCPACGYINRRPINTLIPECTNENCSDPSAIAC